MAYVDSAPTGDGEVVTLAELIADAIEPALALLPPQMDTTPARALLCAIAAQESGLIHRRQLYGGPARGLYQFEPIGVAGVLTHPASRDLAPTVCAACRVEPRIRAVHDALERDDVLASAFARLLLWTDPAPLPDRDNVDGSWRYYLRCWKPGLPRVRDWPANHAAGWAAVG